MKASVCYFLISVMAIASCSPSGPGLFNKRSAHQAYADKISDAGLRQTRLGELWFAAAERSLIAPSSITTPYKEAGYFSDEEPRAVGLRFKSIPGEKLKIDLVRRPAQGFRVYLELWKLNNGKPRLIAALDSNSTSMEEEVEDATEYIIRLQPELLAKGEYTLSISSGPSLAFPVKGGNRKSIQSYWGDARDRGGRKHEGIDIFASKRTPAIAAANGTVTTVNENQLGGKVVWMRPEGKSYMLYYAHLDEQLATEGSRVKIGDTLGLVGNTGNAMSTSPHLHFGIYGRSGALDPLTFVDPIERLPETISAPASNLNKLVRTERSSSLNTVPDENTPFTSLPAAALLHVEAASGNQYRVRSADGSIGYINSSLLSPLNKPIRQLQLKADHPLFDEPDLNAARKKFVKAGDKVSAYARSGDYYYVKDSESEGWLYWKE